MFDSASLLVFSAAASSLLSSVHSTCHLFIRVSLQLRPSAFSSVRDGHFAPTDGFDTIFVRREPKITGSHGRTCLREFLRNKPGTSQFPPLCCCLCLRSSCRRAFHHGNALIDTPFLMSCQLKLNNQTIEQRIYTELWRNGRESCLFGGKREPV